MDGIGWTDIRAIRAQDTFRVFHRVICHHFLHLQTHWARFGAFFTCNACLWHCPQAVGWPGKYIPDLAPDDHKWRHPANGMACTTTPEQDCQTKKEGHDDIKNNVVHRLSNRDSPISQKKEIHTFIAACLDREKGDKSQPDEPDHPFDIIQPYMLDAIIISEYTDRPHRAAGADPGAP